VPKKTRKMKQRAAERRGMQSVPPEGGTVIPGMPVSEAPVRTRSDFAAARAATPLTYDYSYIYGDLRRIAVFAGFFFIVLVALSFLIK
jgi:hypothetical protein